jgi:hypothetical protein
VRAHRIVLVPVAVIVMALVVALSSSWNSSATPIPESPIIVVAEPTATAIGELTAVNAPTTELIQPTEIVTTSIPCTPAGIVAAHWPMLPADVQEEMYSKPLNRRDRPYDSPIIEVNSPITDAQQSLSFTELAAKCGGRLVLSNPIAHYPNDATQTTALCLAPRCVIVAPEYRAVLVRNDIVKKDQKALSISFDPLFYFFDRPNSLEIATVGFFGEIQAESWSYQTLLQPFVQSRIMIMRAGNPLWPSEIGNISEKKILVKKGQSYFDNELGLVNATTDKILPQLFRTVNIPDIPWSTGGWSNGNRLSAIDFVTGFKVNSNHTQGLIVDVTELSSAKIGILYTPGLPKSIADAIAPLAIQNSDDIVNILNGDIPPIFRNSSGNWAINGSKGSYYFDHKTESDKSFTFESVSSLDSIRYELFRKEYDVLISDSAATPNLLNGITDLTDFEYTIRLVPTGSLWVLHSNSSERNMKSNQRSRSNPKLHN